MGEIQRITDTDVYAAKNKERGFRFGFWDLETTSLNASFGHILCNSVIGIDDEKPQTQRIDEFKSYKERAWDDRLVCIKTRDALEEYDVLISYNGFRFDIPFLNSRLVANNQKVLDIRIKHVDLIAVPRYRMRLSGNSLEGLLAHLQAQHRKTPLDPALWRRAVGGDQKSMDKIVKHNVADVVALREVFFRLKPFLDIQFRLVR